MSTDRPLSIHHCTDSKSGDDMEGAGDVEGLGVGVGGWGGEDDARARRLEDGGRFLDVFLNSK